MALIHSKYWRRRFTLSSGLPSPGCLWTTRPSERRKFHLKSATFYCTKTSYRKRSRKRKIYRSSRSSLPLLQKVRTRVVNWTGHGHIFIFKNGSLPSEFSTFLYNLQSYQWPIVAKIYLRLDLNCWKGLHCQLHHSHWPILIRTNWCTDLFNFDWLKYFKSPWNWHSINLHIRLS